MKKLPVSNDSRMVLVDDDDFERLSQYKWRFAWNYISTSIYDPKTQRGSSRYIHRMIMNPEPGAYVDHKDGDAFNNQKANLRFCTHSQNCQNRKKYSKINRYKGVTKRPGYTRWRARIMLNRKLINLGDFPTEREAAIAYNKAAQQYFGEFAKLNEMTEAA